MDGIQSLRAFRESRSLSLGGLGELLGVARATVLRWETGERKPGAGKLQKITEVTGIPARDLRPDLAAHMEAAE